MLPQRNYLNNIGLGGVSGGIYESQRNKHRTCFITTPMTDIDISIPNRWIILEKYSAPYCGLTFQLSNTFEIVIIQNSTTLTS